MATGAITPLVGSIRPEAVDSGGYWFGDLAPNEQLGASPDDLERWDLATHTTSLWFSRPSKAVYLLGTDNAGVAVVLVTSYLGSQAAPTEIWSISRPGNETRIYTADGSGATLSLPIGMISDKHGLWFGDANGVLLYTAAAGMQKVSDVPGLPANGCA